MNNDATHSRTCSRCHYLERNNCEFTSTVYPPTCTKGGYTEHVCDICTFKYYDYTDPLGHDWSKWVEDPGQDTHTHTCQRVGCGATETKVHNWSEWVYEDEYEDICPYEDTMIRYCPDCGATQRKTVQCKPYCLLPLIIGGTITGATITGIVAAWNTAITATAIGGGIAATLILAEHIIPELEKLHSVTYKVDGEIYRCFAAKEGGPVPVPKDPEVAGKEFAGWEPEVPEVMPDHDLVFEATWEEESIIDTIIPQTGSATSKAISVSVTAGLALAVIAIFKKKKED
jgi:LPXTG-motif cell wall-anchored protein